MEKSKNKQQDTTKRIEEEEVVAQIKSGEITQIYPILKPGDWSGIRAGALKQTFFGTPENPELVIAFGYDAPTNFVFITYNDVEGKDSSAILTEAYQNLEKFDQEFEMASSFNGRVLLASGGDFSSEKILCKSHMIKAHKLLDSDELLVSIPRRRCMMITSRDEDDDLLNTFIGLHKDAWNDDSYGNAPILDALFVVKDGLIEDYISL
jgi:hypothetical protein